MSETVAEAAAEAPVKKKSKGASPTARSLAECRKRGWPYYVTEKWIAATKQRKDAFGFGDLLVLDGQQGSLLIQACRTADMATRTTKIVNECSEAALAWLKAGNRIEVWGWAMRGAAGKQKRWTLRRIWVRSFVYSVDGELAWRLQSGEVGDAA